MTPKDDLHTYFSLYLHVKSLNFGKNNVQNLVLKILVLKATIYCIILGLGRLLFTNYLTSSH